MGRKRLPFNFKVNDLVLVKWNDGVYYYGKLSKISKRDRKCTVVFDDRSKEQVKFNQIFDVNDTTTDLEFCMKCKQSSSLINDELVFCDRCNASYHQKCHVPTIPDEVLDPNEEWICTYCEQGIACPYVVNQEEVVSVLYTSPQRKRTKSFKSEEEEASVKQKKRKLAALSPPRCSNGSTQSDDASEKSEVIRKLTLDINTNVEDRDQSGADSLVQIPFSALTPDKFPPSSPLFTAIKNHWDRCSSISVSHDSHVTTNGDPMLSSVAGSDSNDPTISITSKTMHSEDSDPLIPPSPCLSDTDEEFEEITEPEHLPEVTKGDSFLHADIDVKSVIKQDLQDDIKDVTCDKEQSSASIGDMTKVEPFISSEKLIYDIVPATCVVQVTLPYPICLALPANWKDQEPGESVCLECGKKAGFLCSGCKAAWYCGTECQLKAWPVHIKCCVPLQ